MRAIGLSLFAILSTTATAATVSLEDPGSIVTLTPGFEPLALLTDDTVAATDLSFLGQIYTSARGWTTATLHLDLESDQLTLSQGGRSLGNFEIQDLLSYYGALVLEENDFSGLDPAIKALRIAGEIDISGATFNPKTLRCEPELDDFGECDNRCEDEGYPGSLTGAAWADGGCVLLCTCYDEDGNKIGTFIEEDNILSR